MRNIMKIHIIFRQRGCQKCTADIPETGIFMMEFLRKKWVNMLEQVIYKKILSCPNEIPSPSTTQVKDG